MASRVSQLATRNSYLTLLGFVALLVALVPTPVFSSPSSRHIRVAASSYQYLPAEIAVGLGDRVTIELESTDVVHGLYLDGYDLSLTVDPGQTATLTFTAERPGSFRFRCSVTCGPLHPFMIGKLNVGPNWLLWRGATLAVLASLGAGYFAVSAKRRESTKSTKGHTG